MVATGWYGVPLVRSDRLSLSSHVDSATVETFDEWLLHHNDDRLAVDLFTGAGGLSLGIQEAGWTIAAGVDFDDRAIETHSHNFTGLSLKMDLGDPAERDRLVEILSKAPIDLIAGGPPCQPFSRAGRNKIRDLVRNHGRDPHDHRKQLWQAYLDIVTRVQPRAILMENVPDMGLADDFAVIRIIEEKLESLGYATSVTLANAWQFGVPQHRKRLILLARNDVERFDWPEQRTDIPTVREAISDLPTINVKAREQVGDRTLEYTESPDISDFAKAMREGAPHGIVYDHMTRRVREDDLKIFSQMTSTTLYDEIPAELRRYRADNFTDKYKRLGWDELSRTITAHIAKDGYWYIHPGENRTLTVREAARIQTFPDRFRFAGTRSDAFKQIGNAVPPHLGRAAASAVAPIEGLRPAATITPRWLAVRETLSTWGSHDRQTSNWFMYPGPEMGTLQAAVMAVLAGSRITDTELQRIMETVRARVRLTDKLLDRLILMAPTLPARNRLGRLTAALGEPAIWESRAHALPGVLNLKPAEESLFTMLLGDQDMLLLTQATLRVGAQVNGTDSDRTNKLTEGRVDLSRLIGAGEGASLRMAAINVIGREFCGPIDRACDSCPLSAVCARSKSLARKPRPDRENGLS